MAGASLMPAVERRGAGRALYVSASGTCYAARGYSLLRSDDWGRRWQRDARIAAPLRQRWPLWSNPTRRLLRRQFYTMELLADGARLVIARDGVYRAGPGETELVRVFQLVRGSRPLSLARDPKGRVVWGEYGGNQARHEMLLYASTDSGRSFAPCFTFAAGTVRHVHQVTYDPYLERFWVMTGDYDSEPGIGLLDQDLQHVSWVVKGSQAARAAQVIVEPDALLYGTDSDVERNAIVRLDKRTGALTRLRDVEGSSLFATSFGGVRLISTCVEKSKVNPERTAVLYASRDSAAWTPIIRARKDVYPFLFQFGTFVLPKALHDAPCSIISGQALTGHDDRLSLLTFGAASAEQ